MADRAQLQSKLRFSKLLSLIVPLSSLIMIFGVLHYVALLNPVLNIVIAVVFAAMEWLFLAGAAKKVENDLKTIG